MGTGVTSLSDYRLALALEAANLGTWTWDMAAGTTAWDVRLEEMHGLPPGGFGGTFEDWLASLYPDDRADCLARVERALADPGPYMLLHRTTWPDGSIHYIECRGRVLTDERGIPTGTTGVAIDVTDREHHKAATSEALAREHELVEVFQQALLPTSLPEVPNTKVAARYMAAQSDAGVGGDWYAVLPLSDGRLGLAIGDVAGHGLDAVADMAAARFSLRALALSDPSGPELVLARLNDVVRVFEGDTMITAIFGVLDPVARHVDVCQRRSLLGVGPRSRRYGSMARRALRSAARRGDRISSPPSRRPTGFDARPVHGRTRRAENRADRPGHGAPASCVRSGAGRAGGAVYEPGRSDVSRRSGDGRRRHGRRRRDLTTSRRSTWWCTPKV